MSGDRLLEFETDFQTQSLDQNSNKFMECSGDNAGAEVATTISAYIPKQLSKKSECKACPEKLKGDNEINLLRATRLKRLSREELIVPSPSFSEFTYDCFTTFSFLQREDLKKKYYFKRSNNIYPSPVFTKKETLHVKKIYNKDTCGMSSLI